MSRIDYSATTTSVARPRLVRLTMAPEALAIRAGLIRMRRRLERFDCTEAEITPLEIVLAEVLNNIVDHALPPGDAGGRYTLPRPQRIEVLLRPSRDGIFCHVIDNGRALPGGPPPECLPQLQARDVAGLSEHGYGWLLIRALARRIRYHRAAEQNHLRFFVPEDEEDRILS